MTRPGRRWYTYAALTLFVAGLIVWARFYTVLVEFAAAHGFPGWQQYVWPVTARPLAQAGRLADLTLQHAELVADIEHLGGLHSPGSRLRRSSSATRARGAITGGRGESRPIRCWSLARR